MTTYKLIELVGTSDVSWDDAAKNAVETAQVSLQHLRIGEVTKMDLKLVDGKITYRTRITLSFKIVDE